LRAQEQSEGIGELKAVSRRGTRQVGIGALGQRTIPCQNTQMGNWRKEGSSGEWDSCKKGGKKITVGTGAAAGEGDFEEMFL